MTGTAGSCSTRPRAKIELVGDDLFVTNVERIARGIEENAANAVLIKLNQIGSLTETIAAIEMARRPAGARWFRTASGETVDSFIADLTVAMGTGHLKTGAPAAASGWRNTTSSCASKKSWGAGPSLPAKRPFAVRLISRSGSRMLRMALQGQQ